MPTYRKRRLRIQELSRHEEKAVVRRVITLFAVTIILGVFMLTFGIGLLGKFADFLGVVFKNDSEVQNQTIPLPPTLDDLPAATNSARLVVSGFATEGEKVALYVNDEMKASSDIRDSLFRYENLELKIGENKIAAKAIGDEKESDYSQAKTVIYDKEEPRLEIKSPTDGQTFYGNNRIKVEGSTDRDSEVFAGGFLASIDLEGNFEVYVPVAEGESTIEVRAIDPAGNVKTQTRKVNFRK